MLPSSRPSHLLSIALSGLTFLAVVAQADPALTNIATYSGGEHDSGAANGNIVGSATDHTGNVTLYPDSSTILWSNNTAAGSGSTLAYKLDGSGNFASGTTVSLDEFNVGLEVWVNLSSVNGFYSVAMINGSGGDGIGVGTINGNWSGLLGGITWLSGATPVAATTGTWTELAIVTTSTGTTFYVNGVETATAVNNSIFYGYNADSENEAPVLRLGSDSTTGGRINGLIDNARFFTFAEGQFSPSMLNLVPVTPVPEPSTYALLGGLAALATAVIRRRRAA